MSIWFSQLVTGFFFWIAFPSAFLYHFQDWKKFTLYLLLPFPVFFLHTILRILTIPDHLFGPAYIQIKVISIPHSDINLLFYI